MSFLQNNFSSKEKENENNEEIQKNINKIDDNKENSLIIIKQLYPKLSEDYLNDENMKIVDKNILILKNEANYEENKNNIPELFLQNLIRRPCPLNKKQIISVMSKFIQNTTLIQKIQKEFQSDKKLDINELSIMCAEILNYIELKKGKVLFRIGDIGDRFYFILSGKISVLKLKEINDIKMNYQEYIDYCMFLLKEKEIFIFNEVIKKNADLLILNSESEVKSIHKILFLRKLKQRIMNQLFPNIKSLYKYLEKSVYKDEDLGIQLEELIEIENNKNNREWKNYLLKKCEPSFNDLVFFEPYESIIDNEIKHSIICFIYEPFMSIGQGLFFGDFALDSEINKRNATIRAEEDTILGYLKSVDYINIFAPKRKLEKLKELNFLYNNFFFGNINTRNFEKNYFHLFSPHEYIRNSVLFSFGINPKSLILLKEGKVSLELKASIIDLHNLIKYLWENIYLSKWYKSLNNYQKKELIPSNIENRIKEFLDEPIIGSLRVLGDNFIKEMNLSKIYQVSILTDNEIIGLEEIYLNIPYIVKGTVIDNKISSYEITIEHFDKFLMEEKQIVFPFIKSAVSKIISLIERFQNFKKNGINMAINKYDKKQLNNNIKINGNRTLIKSKNNIYYRKINNIDGINRDETINKFNHNDFDDNITTNDREKTLIKRNKSLNFIHLLNSSKQNINKKDIFSNVCKYNLKLKTQKRKSSIFSNNKNNLDKKELNNNELFFNNINSSSTEIIPSISDKNNNNNNMNLKNRTIIRLKKELKKINIIKFKNNKFLDLNSNVNSKRSYSFINILNGKNRKK
jgi:CRP-like cAMP-binding protein